MTLEKILDQSKEVRSVVREKVIGYIVAAFGLIAGLAWNDAVKALIERVFPAQNSIWAKFVYAALISVVVVVISVYLVKLGEKKEEKT